MANNGVKSIFIVIHMYVEAGFSSGRKHEKVAVGAHVLVNTKNVVISRCYFAEDS